MARAKNHLTCITAILLSLVMVFAFPMRAFAASNTNDLYAQEAIEEVVIEDVTYIFHYYYENGNRVITVTNSENEKVEKVTHDPNTAVTTYFENIHDEIGMNAAPAGWTFAGSSSQYISWGAGMSAAAVAAAIAVGVGSIGGAAIIAAMGITVLGVLAAGAVGGTVYVETYYMTIPLQPTQYLYVWTFTASTGDSYGPYYYQPVTYYN